MQKLGFVVLAATLAIAVQMGAADAAYTPTPPDNLDFFGAYNGLYLDATQSGGLLYSLLQEKDRAILNFFIPDTADVNGGYTEDPITVIHNGMLDCKYELAVIAAICNKPAGAVCAKNGPWKRDDL